MFQVTARGYCLLRIKRGEAGIARFVQYFVVWILSPSEWKAGICFLEWAFTTGRPEICLWFCFNCNYLPFLDFCASFCWLSQKWELWWEERNYRRKTVREENARWYLREKRMKGKRSPKASRQFLILSQLPILPLLSSLRPPQERNQNLSTKAEMSGLSK